MPTHFYLSRKLEKLLKKHVQKEVSGQPGPLGQWNATMFYVQRKKCLMIIHSPSRYTVILPSFTAKDAKHLSRHFKNAFYAQLVYDGIITDFSEIAALLGELSLHPTNNDKPIIGTQNYHLATFENYWKPQYDSLDNMPVNAVNHTLNSVPYNRGQGYKWDNAVAAMKRTLEHV